MRAEDRNEASGQDKETGMSVVQTFQASAPQPAMSRLHSPKSTSAARLPQRKKTAADENQIIERLKNGDPQALETIFALYSVKLYSVAQRILGEAADTEEVIQDVFWTVYRKAKSFKGDAQFSTWLYRLTVNAALGRVRRAKKKKEVEYEEFLPKFQKDGHHLVRPVVDWSGTLEEKYSQREVQALLGKALDQLKPVDKSVVVLSDVEGFSDKEIAATLNLSVSAVKTRLHRARLFLRGNLAVQLGYSPA
jgi:RNA polymerase sigma-70 factor, ECF subfamily